MKAKDYVSPCNAGSLAKGDLFKIFQDGSTFEVAAHPRRWHINDGRKPSTMVHLQVTFPRGAGWGSRDMDINTPVLRVVGARAGGNR